MKKNILKIDSVKKLALIFSASFLMHSCVIYTQGYSETDGAYYNPHKDTLPSFHRNYDENTIGEEYDYAPMGVIEKNRQNREDAQRRYRNSNYGNYSSSSDWGDYTGTQTQYTGGFDYFPYSWHNPYRWSLGVGYNFSYGMGIGFGFGYNPWRYSGFGYYNPYFYSSFGSPFYTDYFYSPYHHFYNPYYSPYYYNPYHSFYRSVPMYEKRASGNNSGFRGNSGYSNRNSSNYRRNSYDAPTFNTNSNSNRSYRSNSGFRQENNRNFNSGMRSSENSMRSNNSFHGGGGFNSGSSSGSSSRGGGGNSGGMRR